MEQTEWIEVVSYGVPIFTYVEEHDCRNIDCDGDSRGVWKTIYTLDPERTYSTLDLVGEWTEGRVRVRVFDDLGTPGPRYDFDSPDDVVPINIPSDAVGVQIRCVRNPNGIATFCEIGLEEPKPDVEEIYLVNFPETAEVGAFTLFWDGPDGMKYNVRLQVLNGEWSDLATTYGKYIQYTIPGGDVGKTHTLEVSYSDEIGEVLTKTEGVMDIVNKSYPLPAVPDTESIKFSGWLFGSDLCLSLPPDAPILAIFENTAFGDAAGAPVFGEINGRTGWFNVGSPEYLVELDHIISDEEE